MKEAAESVPRVPKEINLSEKDIARFWAKVDKSAGPNGCWIWMASKNKKGYGQFNVAVKMILTHRIAWTLANGRIPHDGSAHGICTLHRCDNPPCCNPTHLFLGTNADNVRDKESKGRGNQPRGDSHFFRRYPERVLRGETHGSRLHPERMARGEANGSAKLAASRVIKIREIHAAGGTSYRKLAAQFGTSPSLIAFIIRRKIWKHI